jgi:hypothetical protein
MIERLYGAMIIGIILVIMPACKVTPQQQEQATLAIEQNLPVIVTGVTKLGLDHWAKKDKAGAKAGAKLIAENIRTVALPYFEGGPLPLVVAAQNAISAIGKAKLPAGAELFIVGALATVQAAVTVPGANEYLTVRQRNDVVAGLKAMADTCERFAK